MNSNTFFLVVGIGIAVAIYLVVKLIQWLMKKKPAEQAPRRRESVRAAAAAPQRREAATVSSQRVDAASHDVLSPERQYSQAPVVSNLWSSDAPQYQSRILSDEVFDENDPYGPEDYRFGSATPVLASLVPSSDEGRGTILRALRNAGYYSPHAWQNFSAVRYLGIVLPILFFGVMLILVPERLEPWMMVGLIVGPMVGWALPGLYVRSKAAQRLREIENGMPDMLDLLNMCVSQGMTVPSAMHRVGGEIHPIYPALSKELNIVTEQARVGSLAQGLTNFSARVDVPEVHSFTSLLIQTEQMGTSVSEALSDYSDSIRESLKQRADEKANAATFKLLFPTVICLMPAVFMFLMGPALIELNRFFARGGVGGLNAGLENTQFMDEAN